MPFARLSQAVYDNTKTVWIDGQKWTRNNESRAPVTYDIAGGENSAVLGKEGFFGGSDFSKAERTGLFQDADPAKPGIQVEDPFGFHAATYVSEAAGEKKAAIVFEGTNLSAVQDWVEANLYNALGVGTLVPKQYSLALQYAAGELADLKKNGYEVVITGHSLGGGLAQYAATSLSTDGKVVQAFTFNPAALGMSTKGKGSASGIVNIVAEGDIVQKVNRATGFLFGTAVMGQKVEIPVNRIGGMEAHLIGPLAQDLQSLDRRLLVTRGLSSKGRNRSLDEDEQLALKEEARAEYRRGLALDVRQDELRRLDKAGEYQLSRSAIDAFGQRVRIEGYILRPAANKVETLVLDFRDQRFDYGSLTWTFNSPVSNLAELGPMSTFAFGGGSASPGNWITQLDTLASNNQDTLRETYTFGAPTAVNFDTVQWRPSSFDYKLWLNGTQKIWDTQTWDATTTHTILRYPAANSVITTWVDNTLNRQTSVCNPCSTNAAIAPTATTATGIKGSSRSRVTFKDNTFLETELWYLDNEGDQAPPASAMNVEMAVSASEFAGRKIDLIYPVRLLSNTTVIQ